MNQQNPTIPNTLQGKVAIVTGASSGIGRAAAEELARRGAKVVVAARRKSELDELVAQLRNEGHEALAIAADVSRETDVANLVDTAVKTYGQLDIAFNNAGTEGVFAPLIEQTGETYGQVFDTNVRGVFYAMKYEALAMLKQGYGSIINNASMGGVIGFASGSLYTGTKHAVVGMTKTASIEWFRQGVRINALCPGLIDTPFQHRGIWPSEEAMHAFARQSPAGRFGTPQEMAKIVAFLASDDSSYISGHALLADGGYSVG